MEFLINTVELIISELNFRISVTVYAPAHAEVSKLIHLAHFLNFTVAGLAILFAHGYVLRMIEINMVGQSVDAPASNPETTRHSADSDSLPHAHGCSSGVHPGVV